DQPADRLHDGRRPQGGRHLLRAERRDARFRDLRDRDAEFARDAARRLAGDPRQVQSPHGDVLSGGASGRGYGGRRRVTPGAHIAAAIDILASIEAGGRPADDIAADYFRRRRYIGAKDRVQIAAHVYAVLRHRASFDWWIARVTPLHGEGKNPRRLR